MPKRTTDKHEGERKPTSLKVDKELWHKFKIRCAEDDLGMSTVIENFIKSFLRKNKSK